MARTSIEKRRAIRALEAKRDKLIIANKKGRADLASVRASLKSTRRS